MVGCRTRILRQDQKKHNRDDGGTFVLYYKGATLYKFQAYQYNNGVEDHTESKKLSETTQDLMEAKEQHGSMVALIK